MPHAQDLITMITSYRASFEEFYPISELHGALRLQFFDDYENKKDDAFFPKFMQYLFIIHAVSYTHVMYRLLYSYIYIIYDSVQNSVQLYGG